MLTIDAMALALPSLGAPAPASLAGCHLRGWRLGVLVAGWFKCPDDAWPHVAEGLAKPWDRSVVLADLTWWDRQVSQGRAARIPGRPTLGKRWGWTDKPVRRLLASESWRSSEGPARVQPRSSGDVEQGGQSDAKVQARSSEGPAEVHTRVGVREREEREELNSLWAAWQSIRTPDGKQPHARARKLAVGDRGPLAARLAESSAADVLLVIEWAHTAPDSWWLANGALGLGTLMRAKGWSDRIESAQAWAEAGRRTSTPRSAREADATQRLLDQTRQRAAEARKRREGRA
jgi:hypothetical protein